ncbi:unnamed protein product [Rhizophagus irregularis]|uniref:Uncharacterized protein n=1 Tax=Rhizophagus irregularis TaxID=588596 RepID=A0A916DYJ3_9GLOM|nr:unnamed protein product [Rhizophagus irregularis]
MRQYNKPTASEVAVIFLDFNYFNQVPNPRDINMDGMIDLLIGSEISRINKGKGRAIKIESNEFNDEQEEEEETKSDDEQEIGDEQAEVK